MTMTTTAHTRTGAQTLDGLRELCRDREQATPELHTPNDFYGHASLLKRYAGLPEEYQLKAVVEHAPFEPSHVWFIDLQAPLPMLLTFATNRHAMLRERGAHTIHALGPLIHYAQPDLDEAELARERERLGRNLLVFPPHSTHYIRADYEILDFCREIDRIAPDFDSVRVCMYWKDVLNGDAELYAERGYELVSAGHMFDPLFTSRFKSLVLCSDMCMASFWSTCIGYALFLEKPLYIRQVACFQHRSDGRPQHIPDFFRQKLMSRFAEYHPEITPEQREIVGDHWGFDHLRSPGELRDLLDRAEQDWRSGIRSIVRQAGKPAEG